MGEITIKDSSVKKTLLDVSFSRIEEKKSVFIGKAFPVKSEEEFRKILDETRKEHHDARHHVFAYILSGNIIRYSDDGEPQGTGGMPVLTVMKSTGAVDFGVIVTRYFGGTLLGTGGLTRAYSSSAREAIDNNRIAEFTTFVRSEVELSYSDYQKFLNDIGKIGITVDNTLYGENVFLSVAYPVSKSEEIKYYITELTNGKANVRETGTEERPL